MPDTTPANTQVLALVMMLSAVTLFAGAVLIWMGVVPIGDEARVPAAVVVGVAAAADFAVGLWFFRKGQSS